MATCYADIHERRDRVTGPALRHRKLGVTMYDEHSTEEEWRPIDGYEGRYEVSSLGRVRSLDHVVEFRTATGDERKLTVRGRLLKLTPNNHGYMQCGLSNKTHIVHALVLAAFHGRRPDGLECRHLDGNKLNNAAFNLTWGTSKENGQDCVRHGTALRGEDNPAAALTENQVREIRNTTTYQHVLAAKFGVSQSTIGRARRGVSWTHLEDE